MRTFISYSRAQGDWVWNRLEPCLNAGGADVLIDRKQFVAGPGVVGQMDATQDQADRHLLVLSHEYVTSAMCLHEMDRAIALDPTFTRQLVVPIRRDDVDFPDTIKKPGALYVDLRDDSRGDQWELLLGACRATLGATAPDWLAARDKIVALLEQAESVNLVSTGPVRWRGLINDLVTRSTLNLARVDLEDPSTVPRRGLIAAILEGLGSRAAVPHAPEDLRHFGRMVGNLSRSAVALEHFDLALARSDYDVNLFAALRYVVTNRQMVLLIQSRLPFLALLSPDHEFSHIDLKTVELKARS